eukprot:m.31741 g.31741  ORF g.31741 m.31741 type:complete len:304 (-) comp8344_c0_seq1:1473-2384(-)
MVQEIVTGVFVGCLEDVSDAVLKEHGIKFLLTVCDVEIELPTCVTHHKTIKIFDEPEEDLLTALPECVAFIQQALDNEVNILVHCISGVSRSTSVIMAYIMESQKLDCPHAFRVLKKAHRPAVPNEGFVQQLKLFHAMGCKLDNENPEFRLHMLQCAVRYNPQDNVEHLPLAPDPHVKLNAQDAGWGEIIRCRKCRRRLVTEKSFLDHSEGTGQLSFRWKKRDKELEKSLDAPVCTSLFIEPMEWMRPCLQEGQLQEKLLCPNEKCKARLGTYNWSGQQCSCGAWITPAFKIVRAKVDIMKAS